MENNINPPDIINPEIVPVQPNNPIPNMTLPGPTVLFKQAWNVYKNRFWVLVCITLLPTALMIAYFAFIAGGLGITSFLTVALSLGIGVSHAAIIAGLILSALIDLAIIYISFWAQTALVFAIKGADQKTDLKEFFKQASHKIGSFFGAALLAGLASAGVIMAIIFLFTIINVVASLQMTTPIPASMLPILLLLATIPAIYLGVRFSLSTLVVVGDNTKALSGVKRSSDYIRGYWWPVFWRLLFLAVIALVLTLGIFFLSIFLGIILKGPLGAISAILLTLVNMVLYAILPPLVVAYCYQIYVSLKNIKGESKVPADKSGALLITIIILALIGLVVGMFVFMLALPGIYMRKIKQTQFQQVPAVGNYSSQQTIPLNLNNQTNTNTTQYQPGSQ